MRYISKLRDAVKLSVCGNTIIALLRDGTLEICGSRPLYHEGLSELKDIVSFAATAERIIALDSLGCAYTVSGSSVIPLWRDIVAVAAADSSAFAVRRDGTVVTDDITGSFSAAVQWSGIAQLAGDHGCLLGLKNDGTVVLCGDRSERHRALLGRTGIVAVRAGCGMAAAITSLGRVILSGAGFDAPAHTSPAVDAALGDELVLVLCENGETAAAGADFMGNLDSGSWINISAIAAGTSCAVGVRLDGAVIGAGLPVWDFVPDDWRDITAVDAGYSYFVGLHRDGTLAVASGSGMSVARAAAGFSNVRSLAAGSDHLTAVLNDGRAVSTEWSLSACRDLISASSGESCTVLLRANGTAEVENNSNLYGECEVISWRNIKQVACGLSHTIGLKADGTVIAVGHNKYGQCDVDSWTGIVAVAAGMNASYGIRADGTVAVAGEGAQCEVAGWHGIRKIAAGRYYAIGIRYDGSVLYAGPPDALPGIECWSDIVDAAADIDAIGLRRDGTVITTEYIAILD